MKAGLLPESSAAALDAMVADFKKHHRTGKINHQALGEFAGKCKVIGGNYGSSGKCVLDGSGSQ